MQIASYGDNLHNMSTLFYGKNKKYIFNLLSAEFAHRVVNVNLGYPRPLIVKLIRFIKVQC